MIIAQVTNRTFHKNGNLEHIETIATLKAGTEHLYKNVIVAPNKTHVIRIGLNARYHDNNQLNWQINYSEKDGSVLNPNRVEYRKDGSIIQY